MARFGYPGGSSKADDDTINLKTHSIYQTPVYRKEHGCDLEWRALLKEFFSPKQTYIPHDKNGYWEPRSIFPSPAIRHFFNGHDIPFGKDKVVHREKFALWAIEEALKEYPPGVFDPAGDAFRDKFVVHSSKNSKSSGKECDDGELMQSLHGAAQALHYASPNCLGPPVEAAATYLQMTKVGKHGHSSLSLYNSPLFAEVNYTTKASDVDAENTNIRAAPDDVWSRMVQQGAHRAKPQRSKQTKGFLDNQVTGIVWILSRLFGELPRLKSEETPHEWTVRNKMRGPKYGGAILADSMGLGKTLTAIASIELMASGRLNVKYDEETGMRMYRPILILVPNLAVACQWVDEILLNTSPKSIRNILVAGGNSSLFTKDDRVSHLAIDCFKIWPHKHRHVWDPHQRKAAKTIIICPIDTWANRTLYETMDVSDEEADGDRIEGDGGDSNKSKSKKSWHSRLTEQSRGFSIVCVDEAHKVKNTTTKLHKSVSLLERDFMLLITATPCTNSLGDLRGLMELLWNSALEQINKNDQTRKIVEDIVGQESLEKMEEVISSCPPYDDLQLIAGCPELMGPLIRPFANGSDPDLVATRRFLHFFESLAMLKRGPGSFLFEDFEHTKRIPLDGLYPGVESRTVNIEFDPITAAAYQSEHLQLLVWYLKSLNYFSSKDEDDDDDDDENKSDEDSEDDPRYFKLHRQWQIASSSMDVFKIDTLFEVNGFGPKTEPVSIMRRAGVSFIRLAELLLGPHEPSPKTALDYLKVAIRGSPTLRYILYDIKENVLSKRNGTKIKKVLITENVPMLAYYYELVLQFIGINCRVLHAGLGHSERKDLITDFNSYKMESVQVLIQMYTVGFAGTNLHKNCSRVIIAAQAHSLAVQWQAVHRVIRVGQTQKVDVVRIKVLNSYHAFRESQQVTKIVPELSIRVQGATSHILIQILNNFQYEIDELCNSSEGQKILQEAENARSASTTRHPTKKRKLNLREAISIFPGFPLSWVPRDHSDDDDTDDESVCSNVDTHSPSAAASIGAPCRNPFGSVANDMEWMQRTAVRRSQDATSMRTRISYYPEFKTMGGPTQNHFDHRKHLLRRLVLFRGVEHGGLAPMTWEIEHLHNPAVIERALEIVLRVISGTGYIELVPFPQIDFSQVPQEVLIRVGKLVEAIKAGKRNLRDIMTAEDQALDASEEGDISEEEEDYDEEEDNDDDDNDDDYDNEEENFQGGEFSVGEEEVKEEDLPQAEKVITSEVEATTDNGHDMDIAVQTTLRQAVHLDTDRAILRRAVHLDMDIPVSEGGQPQASPKIEDCEIKDDPKETTPPKDEVTLKDEIPVKEEEKPEKSFGNPQVSPDLSHETKSENDEKAFIKIESIAEIKTKVKMEPIPSSSPQDESVMPQISPQALARLGNSSSPIDLTIEIFKEDSTEDPVEAPDPLAPDNQTASQPEIITIEDDDSIDIINIDSDSDMDDGDDDEVIFISERSR